MGDAQCGYSWASLTLPSKRLHARPHGCHISEARKELDLENGGAANKRNGTMLATRQTTPRGSGCTLPVVNWMIRGRREERGKGRRGHRAAHHGIR